MSSDPLNPWLATPKVQLLGSRGRRFTVQTDGRTARFKDKPDQGVLHGARFGGRSWPTAPDAKSSPWLAPLPVALHPGQTLITDGERSRVKAKPGLPAHELEESQSDSLATTTTTTPAPTTPPPTTPPPTTPPPTTPPPTTPPPTTSPPATTDPPATTSPPNTTSPPDP